MAVVGSALVVRYQVSQRRKEQETQGVRSSEKLSWEERLAIEEQKIQSEDKPRGAGTEGEAPHCHCEFTCYE